MPAPHDRSVPPSAHPSGGAGERRRRRPVGDAARNPRVEAAQYVARHRLEGFHRALIALAGTVFGPEASVVAHLRTEGRQRRLVFVVDAADPSALVDYAGFLPREQAFWTAYAHVPKPDLPFGVAVRPARGWCRTEALAPLFAFMPTLDDAT